MIIASISVFNYNLIKSFVVFYGIWYLVSKSRVSDIDCLLAGYSFSYWFLL
jgi:hypothetical protein